MNQNKSKSKSKQTKHKTSKQVKIKTSNTMLQQLLKSINLEKGEGDWGNGGGVAEGFNCNGRSLILW